MKCPGCGAEVQAQRFCIYCGERLCAHESIRVQRAPSGVMRIRHRANISQTSLPEVQKKNESLKENKLASLNSQKVENSNCENDIVAAISSQRVQKVTRPGRPCSTSTSNTQSITSTEGNEMKDSQSLRQSRELEALLFKLNGSVSGEEKAVEPEKHINANEKLTVESLKEEQDISMENEIDDIIDNGMDNSMELDRTYSDDEYNSFFEVETSGEYEQDISSTIPVGSGSFSRVPSGGFHLVIDSVKSACQGMISRIKSIRKSSSRTVKTNETDDKECGYFNENSKNRKYAKIGIMAAILLAIIAITISVASSDNSSEQSTEIAAQTTVAGNEDFAILPLDDSEEGLNEDFGELTFDEDDFSIPALDEKDLNNAAAAQETKPVEVAKNEPAPSKGRLTEIRLYDQNDNVLGTTAAGETYKVKNSCIMRQGPASRFGLVKQIPAGANIQILTNVEEDWILQGGGVWTKDGHNSKLGPGDQFADALKGMKLPQPKSRVISAKNWKYVQFGKVYGYVGPACFK